MSDQCKHCVIRGDLEKCLKEDCSKHENWINQQILARIKKLKLEKQSLIAVKVAAQKFLKCSESNINEKKAKLLRAIDASEMLEEPQPANNLYADMKVPLSKKEQKLRKPQPPEELVDALNEPAHRRRGKARSAQAARIDPDPWLGVWRAKKSITLSVGAIMTAVAPNKEIEILKEDGPFVTFKIADPQEDQCSKRFLQANFEKVETDKG